VCARVCVCTYMRVYVCEYENKRRRLLLRPTDWLHLIYLIYLKFWVLMMLSHSSEATTVCLFSLYRDTFSKSPHKWQNLVYDEKYVIIKTVCYSLSEHNCGNNKSSNKCLQCDTLAYYTIDACGTMWLKNRSELF